MKLNIEIDCTPQEARAFFGLPDVAPLQEEAMRQIQERMAQAVGAMDMDTLLKTWLPAGLQGMEQMQKRFWDFAAGAAGGQKGGR